MGALRIKIIEDAKTILDNPGQKYNYFGWPSIARLQNGKLAVTCSGFRRAHVCPFGKAVMMTSDDEGQSYTGAEAVIDTPLDDRDSGVVPFGENGVIITSFNNTRAAQRGWNPDNAEFMAYVDTVTDEDEARWLGSTFRMSFDGGQTFGDGCDRQRNGCDEGVQAGASQQRPGEGFVGEDDRLDKAYRKYDHADTEQIGRAHV